MSRLEQHAQLRCLYERHFDLVWAALAVHGVGTHEREDLVQEVWLLAHRRLPRLRGEASARAWLWSITRNIVRQHRRATQRRDRKLRALETVRSADPSFGLDHEGRVATDQALAALPVAQREVIVLTHQLGYSGPEIAALLGVSLNTVHSRLRLATARLRRDLDGEQTQAARRRCWSAVLAGLATPSSGVVASGWTKAAAVAGLAILTIVWTPESPRGPTEPDPVHLHARREQPLPDAPRPKAGSLPAAEAPIPATPDRAMEAAEPHVAAAVPAPKPRARTTRKRAPRPKVSPPAPAQSLSADVELVHEGLEHNRAGRYQRALATFERHARRFPNSPVWDAREGGWIRALCALGRVEQARKHARRTLDRGGSSIAIKNSLASCSTVTSPAGAGHSVSP